MAYDDLELLFFELETCPFILHFVIVAQIDERTYEIQLHKTVQKQHAILRTINTVFTSKGEAQIAAVGRGSTEVQTKDGFKASYPVFEEALSETGALALTVKDAKNEQEDLWKRIREAEKELVAALVSDGYGEKDSEDLLTYLRIELDPSLLNENLVKLRLRNVQRSVMEFRRKQTLSISSSASRPEPTTTSNSTGRPSLVSRSPSEVPAATRTSTVRVPLPPNPPVPMPTPISAGTTSLPVVTPAATANVVSVASSAPTATPSLPKAPEVSGKSGFSFKLIAAGEYWMGSSEQDRPSDPTEKPRHRVRLTQDFELAAHETTVGQYRKFVEATGYQTTVEKNKLGGWQANWSTSKGKRDPQCTWRNPGFPQTDEHPVTVVSHDDAAAFCRWLSAEESAVYRLPTEAEWEYACRAGGDGIRHSGSEPLASFAWDSNNSEGKTHPVGMLRPNAWGVFDLYGNVREWCSDRWQASYVAAGKSDPIGPATGSQYSWRGGSWQDGSSFVRSAKRGGYDPDEAFNNLGFRVVRELGKP